VLDDVKTTACWREVCPSKSERLAEACNEWYLFHGTSPEAARQICESSFKLNLSGTRTGTLYGKGVYCAESITKADEYAKPNSAGRYAVLLCRVLGGRVRQTEEVAPDPEELLQSCIHGVYDSVVGDREKCKGTFREFVVFDTAALYPEYVIEYSRSY
jgi:hypothetical protein